MPDRDAVTVQCGQLRRRAEQRVEPRAHLVQVWHLAYLTADRLREPGCLILQRRPAGELVEQHEVRERADLGEVYAEASKVSCLRMTISCRSGRPVSALVALATVDDGTTVCGTWPCC